MRAITATTLMGLLAIGAAVFIIGTEGTVKFIYANPDYKVRLSSDALLAAARSCIEKPEQGAAGEMR